MYYTWNCSTDTGLRQNLSSQFSFHPFQTLQMSVDY